MAEKVATAGIRRKKGFMLYVKDGAVWRVRKKREGEVPEQPEMVSDLGFEMDPNYIYFVDKDGDVSRAKASETEGFAEEEKTEEDSAGQRRSDQQVAETRTTLADTNGGAAAIPTRSEKLPEELLEGAYREGQGVQITVNRYERDASARAACLKHFGAVCQMCGVELSTIYGPIAAGLVHVHHLRPLSQVEGEYEVRPEHDLIPVCPNCHAVAHRRDPPLTPSEVREVIAQARVREA